MTFVERADWIDVKEGQTSGVIRRMGRVKPCANCGKLTPFFDEYRDRRICSKKCLIEDREKKGWN